MRTLITAFLLSPGKRIGHFHNRPLLPSYSWLHPYRPGRFMLAAHWWGYDINAQSICSTSTPQKRFYATINGAPSNQKGNLLGHWIRGATLLRARNYIYEYTTKPTMMLTIIQYFLSKIVHFAAHHRLRAVCARRSSFLLIRLKCTRTLSSFLPFDSPRAHRKSINFGGASENRYLSSSICLLFLAHSHFPLEKPMLERRGRLNVGLVCAYINVSDCARMYVWTMLFLTRKSGSGWARWYI